MQTGADITGRRAGPTAGICVPRPVRAAIFAVMVALSCLFAVAGAVEMKSLYTVEVLLNPDEANARDAAYRTALIEVLIRVTGTTAIVESERIDELFPQPGRYVTQYRARPDGTLSVSFDGDGIEQELRRAGASIWERNRPLTVIWIAVDWGQGQREIVAADDPERRPGDSRSIDRNRMLHDRVVDVAERRGIPVVFPLLDAEDLENMSFTDIWGGFDDQLLAASARYQAETVLVGRIRPGSPSMNRWTWHFGNERATWSGEPEEVINLLADSLAARLRVDSSAPVDSIRMTISGIDSVEAFGRVQRYIENLRGIDDIMIENVAGDHITYNVRFQGGIERLRRALESNSVLVPVDPFDNDDAGISFDAMSGGLRQRATIEYLYRPDR